MIQVAGLVLVRLAPAWFALAITMALPGCVLSSRTELGVDAPEVFAPEIASTRYSEARLTISPDGHLALWFSRNRPGGAGGYDIWLSRRVEGRWREAEPAPFNSRTRDFDPAFSADGRHVYFSSDRPGGLGGDDLWRVPVIGTGFGEPEHLGAAVNSPKNEWAPMLSPDGRTLLFSSDGRGAARMDLFIARRAGSRFTDAAPLPGDINTGEDEFDATFLADGKAVVFTRAPDLSVDTVRLFLSVPRRGRHGTGVLLPERVNTPNGATYAPMLDWSRPDHLLFTTIRPADSPRASDLYVVKYRH